MAEVGERTGSVIDSEEFYSFTCAPCFRKGRTTGAEVYCVQCEEDLCKICLDNHNSFAKMVAHTIQDRDQMETKGPQRIKTLLTVPCEEHPGQVYSLYCSKHDNVCCPVCSQVKHKLCDVDYIPDVLHDATASDEMGEFKRASMTLQVNLRILKDKRMKDMENLTAEKDKEVDKIQRTIKEMTKELQSIEKSTIDDVLKSYNKYKIYIENDVDKIDVALNALGNKSVQLEKAGDEVELFVLLKVAIQIKDKGKELMQCIQTHVGKEGFACMIENKAKTSVKKLESLSKFVLDNKYSVTVDGKHKVETTQDKKLCDVNSICLTNDDTILMTDGNNKCLKRFDNKFRLMDRLETVDEPYCVCSMSSELAAITVPNIKTVQMVTLGTTMRVSKSFKTPGDCHGILWYKDHLYITCGSFSEICEGPCYIAIYSASGTFEKKIETDSKGRLFSSLPVDIAVRSMHDDVILLCDALYGLVAIGQDGQRLWTATCDDLGVESVTRVNVDRHGQALVSSYRSNKVVLVSRNGTKLGELLTARDGMHNPVGLCFDTQRSRLMVSMRIKNHITVFKLEEL